LLVRVGITELVIVLAIVLLMFGSKKLPELADGMGKAIRNFKKGIQNEDEDVTPITPADKQVGAHSGASELHHEAAGTPAERKS
jgi:sec-independent protein translocase protein TatA